MINNQGAGNYARRANEKYKEKSSGYRPGVHPLEAGDDPGFRPRHQNNHEEERRIKHQDIASYSRVISFFKRRSLSRNFDPSGNNSTGGRMPCSNNRKQAQSLCLFSEKQYFEVICLISWMARLSSMNSFESNG